LSYLRPDLLDALQIWPLNLQAAQMRISAHSSTLVFTCEVSFGNHSMQGFDGTISSAQRLFVVTIRGNREE
jgi:hypothetical protein